MWILPSLIFALHSINLLVEAQLRDEWWDSKYPSTKCCECVPFFGCVSKIVDFKRLTKLSKLSNHEISENPIINAQTCPSIIDYCCRIPDADEICDLFPFGKTPPEISKRWKPKLDCTCTKWDACPQEGIITDGEGKTSNFFTEAGLVSHSKCTEDLDVCCFSRKIVIKDRITSTTKSVITTPMEEMDVKTSVIKDVITSTSKPVITTPMKKMDPCKCVKRDLCSESNPRVTRETCPQKEDVCCPEKFIKDPPKPKTNTSSSQIFSNSFTIILSILLLIKFV